MRLFVITALSASLVGCAASRQEVVQRLGQQFVGRNVDELVREFGPPGSAFKMNSGETSYLWQLTAITDIVGDRDYAQAQARFCKVSVIAAATGIVTHLTTEDSNAGGGIGGMVGAFGSICARRLGMRPRS